MFYSANVKHLFYISNFFDSNRIIMSSRSQLDELISHFAKGNKAEFARLLGISRQYLNIWYSREYFDIKKVFKACPGVSAEWLITGEGEMLTEKRLPDVLDGDILIPFINTEDVILGKWYNTSHFIIVRGYELFYNFITRMPSVDLASYISFGAILGCCIVAEDKLLRDSLYIVRTGRQGTFFVQYLGDERTDGFTVHKFTTRRGNQIPEIQLALPSEDIVQCAEITDYLVNSRYSSTNTH